MFVSTRLYTLVIFVYFQLTLTYFMENKHKLLIVFKRLIGVIVYVTRSINVCSDGFNFVLTKYMNEGENSSFLV